MCYLKNIFDLGVTFSRLIRLWDMKPPKKIIMKKEKLLIRTKKGAYVIFINEIIYCKADGRYTCILTSKETLRVTECLKSIENKICSSMFVRIHQSFLVNINCIREYLAKNSEVKLFNDCILRISKSRKKYFLNKISEYYK